jgi:hypothetical protein
LARVVQLKKIKNSDKFRQAAINFDKYGYYTAAPKGTTAWREFWKEERRRSVNGFTADDGDHVTGYFYFYLNYCKIVQNIEREITNPRTGKTRKVLRREKDFPLFYDYDKEYFDAIEAAENEGKHLVVVKRRGAGYSWKGASMLIRNFFLLKSSISYAIAAEAEFLTKDGLLTKAWDLMDFIDEHTAWAKKRQKIDTKMHKRASIVINKNGVKSEIGYKSEIIGVTLKNDPQKARGKRGKLILGEEAGKFPGLKEAWQVARPSVEEDATTFGLMIAYGTGGTEEANYEGLKDLFYEPDAYNCFPIENIWDDGALKPCGFFVPQYVNMRGEDKDGKHLFMDVDGNSLVDKAKEYSLKEREKVSAHSSDRTSVDRFIAERPFTPQEATLQISGNIFPKKDLIRHLSNIRNNVALHDFKQVGELYYDADGATKWEQNPDLKDHVKYRVDPDTDKSGAIVIWEHPVEDAPYGLYIAGCDPYDHDKSGTNSLGSCFIYKRFQNFESYYDLPVAEYTGRPDTAEEYYENVRKLLRYYNAKLLYENEKKGLYAYFSHKHCEFLLADQPDIIKDIMRKSTVERGKGIHMNKSIKDWGEILIRDWLTEEYAPGKMNLTKIFSEPLLEELIAFNDEGNFDRVMAFMMVMIYQQELHHVHVKKKKQDTKARMIFPDGIFTEDKRFII